MTKFQVWSHGFEQPEQLETTRTDRAVAYQDAKLIRDILGRSAEVREIERASQAREAA